MIKVGLTGGIGSGKTTVAKVFETLGVPVYYSDVWAKIITVSDKNVINALVLEFGNEVYLADGELNKPYLSKLIFENKDSREKINNIIHPAVAKHFDEWVKDYEEVGKKYVIKEAAILFESGAYKQVDKIITVVTDVEQRIERVIKRDNNSKEEVLQKIKAQISDEEKVKLSDFVIRNNDDDMILPQVLEINETISNI